MEKFKGLVPDKSRAEWETGLLVSLKLLALTTCLLSGRIQYTHTLSANSCLPVIKHVTFCIHMLARSVKFPNQSPSVNLSSKTWRLIETCSWALRSVCNLGDMFLFEDTDIHH